MKSPTLKIILSKEHFDEIKLDPSLSYCFLKQKEELASLELQEIELGDFIHNITKNKHFPIFKKCLNSIREDCLYKSITHGIYHNERVCLFSFYLATQLNLPKEDILLSLYAGMYHDIGRSNDLLDDYHGYESAKKLPELMLDISQEDLNILKAIITGHSLDDRLFDEIAKEYKVKNHKRAKILYNILKDADGLDRTRLENPYVNMVFMRNKISLQLIPLSYILYSYYQKITP